MHTGRAPTEGTPRRRRHTRINRRALIAIATGFMALAVTLQVQSGAFRSEFAGDTDEASHYVTGLMVRDSVTGGWGTTPPAFANDYYSHYSEVAPGHWPPVFYILEAGWMMVFGTTRVSILLLMALVTAALATSTAVAVRSSFGWWPGLLAGLAFVALPHVQKQTVLVMPELFLAFLAFAAALCLVRYMETGTMRNALAFGALATLCVLTKGNGWAILLVPPLAFLFTGNRRLLNRRFLACAAVLLSVCAAWQLFSTPFLRHVWMPGAGSLSYLNANLVDALGKCLQLAGVPLTALALAGAAFTCIAPVRQRRPVPPLWAALVSLVVAVCAFNALVPLPVSHGKLLMALPAILMLAVAGFTGLSAHLGKFGVRPWRLRMALLATLILTSTFTLVRKESRGFIAAADAVFARSSAHGSIYLVSGTAVGEGAFIAEIAMRDKQREATVLRATKTLAGRDSNGGYEPLAGSTAGLRQRLARSSVSTIVMEDARGLNDKPHHDLLARMLREHPLEWTPLPLIEGGESGVRVWLLRRALNQSVVRDSAARSGAGQ